jgi:hypothetical protein
MPERTCTPWVIRYRFTGRDGQKNHDGGCWMAWLISPVTKQVRNAIPSHRPIRAVAFSWCAALRNVGVLMPVPAP